MKLRKALKQAMALNCCLTRKAWLKMFGNDIFIDPACKKGQDAFLWVGGRVKASGWEPEAGDILATDWILLKP